jgi:hypothetical protein
MSSSELTFTWRTHSLGLWKVRYTLTYEGGYEKMFADHEEPLRRCPLLLLVSYMLLANLIIPLDGVQCHKDWIPSL